MCREHGSAGERSTCAPESTARKCHVCGCTDDLLIGENEHGWQFCVARVEGQDRWVGCGLGKNPGNPDVVFLFAEIAEGHVLGVPDRDEAIRMTCAIARDPENSYGGITTWHVQEDLRAEPDDYRCHQCGAVCCSGECQDEGFYEELDDVP